MVKKVKHAAKLAELLGLDTADYSHYETDVKKRVKLKRKLGPRIQSITEDEIQNFREMQGIIYFLQAPALFSKKVCRRKECGVTFLVSRKDVAYCSYNCIKRYIEDELGLQWYRDGQLEELINDPSVYNKNEPIWIKNLDKIRELVN